MLPSTGNTQTYLLSNCSVGAKLLHFPSSFFVQFCLYVTKNWGFKKNSCLGLTILAAWALEGINVYPAFMLDASCVTLLGLSTLEDGLCAYFTKDSGTYHYLFLWNISSLCICLFDSECATPLLVDVTADDTSGNLWQLFLFMGKLHVWQWHVG